MAEEIKDSDYIHLEGLEELPEHVWVLRLGEWKDERDPKTFLGRFVVGVWENAAQMRSEFPEYSWRYHDFTTLDWIGKRITEEGHTRYLEAELMKLGLREHWPGVG